MKSPISFSLATAGVATQLKGKLYRFQPARTGKGPDWSGPSTINTIQPAAPITAPEYWYGRYVLTRLTIGTDSEGEELTLSDAVVAVTRTNHIVNTTLVGRAGTVKEHVGAADYDMNIAVGLQALDGDNIADEYPAELLRTMVELLEKEQTLRVESEFLSIFGINRIAIKSYSLTQDTASNYQELTISAVSDEDYDITGADY